MSTVDRLKRLAKRAAIGRGHTLTRFRPFDNGQSYMTVCARCGNRAFILPSDQPQIYGSAVSLKCKGSL